MSTATVLNLSSAPRDPNELVKFGQGVLYRLGLQLEMFPDEDAERAFLGAAHNQQAQIISAALLQYDQTGAGRIDAQPQVQPPMATQGQPQMQPPAQMTMPNMPAVVPPQQMQPQPQMQQQPSFQPQMAAPQMGQPQFPTPMPQMQQMQQPMMAPPQNQQMPQMGFQQPQMGLPQALPQQRPQPQMAPQGQPMGFPGQMGAIPMQMPVQAVAPQPQRQPSTASDPGGNGAAPPQAAIVGILQKLTKSQEATQKWLEEIQQTLLGQTRMMQTALAVQLFVADNSGIKIDELAKIVKNVGDQTVSDFMQSLLSSVSGKGG